MSKIFKPDGSVQVVPATNSDELAEYLVDAADKDGINKDWQKLDKETYKGRVVVLNILPYNTKSAVKKPYIGVL